MKGGSTSRRRSRELALQVLYSADLAQGDAEQPVTDTDRAFSAVADHFELSEGSRTFAKELCSGVAARRVELDAELTACTEHWRLERMAAVDRNILRLAAYELLTSSTPAPVVIDEAVELARRFGGERSPGFVNGVLDALAHAHSREGV